MLFVNLCAAPLVSMVQSGTEQEVLAKAAAAEFEHRSKRSKKHTLKLHKEKNADGQSVHAVMMCAKRKYSGHADEETANYQCPNCLKYYVFDSPRDKRGKKRVHQQCEGGKAQVLVPYPALH
jgi:hypothetical protein